MKNIKAIILGEFNRFILELEKNTSYSDKVKGLAIGGDDYITKSFSVKVVIIKQILNYNIYEYINK